MIVTTEHLKKFLKKKMQQKSYGSVLIHFKDGQITGISDKNDWNTDAFVKHVDQPLTRAVVRIKKPATSEGGSELVKTGQNGQIPEQDLENSDQNKAVEKDEKL